MTITDQERAEKSVAVMWGKDQASKGLGVKLDNVGPGKAQVSLAIEAKHLNGHKTCHGGYVFTLADSAFGCACNTYNQFAVSHVSTITNIAPTFEGDELKAVASEVSRRGRNGIYDVRVTNQNGELIAEFRGHSRTIKGQHFEE